MLGAVAHGHSCGGTQPCCVTELLVAQIPIADPCNRITARDPEH